MSLQEPKEHIEFWAGFYPNHLLGSYIDTDFMNHHARKFLPLLFGRPFPALPQIEERPGGLFLWLVEVSC
jgi:hypothetical protein